MDGNQVGADLPGKLPGAGDILAYLPTYRGERKEYSYPHYECFSISDGHGMIGGRQANSSQRRDIHCRVYKVPNTNLSNCQEQ